MLFTYRAVTVKGEKVKGTIEAFDRKDAGTKLNEKGLRPVAIQELVLPHARLFDPLFGKVRSDELLIFYSQLYDMVSAGIGFLKSLEMISEQTRNRKLKNAIDDISALLRKGTSISDAFEQHEDIFPPLFISMIKSGEASGELETVLRNYNVLYDEHLEIQRKTAGALFYPMILFCLGMAVILFLVAFIVPKFVEIFSTAGIALPMITQVLYVFGTAMIRYWYLILGVTGLAAWGIWRYLKTEPGRYLVDSLKLAVPVFGPLNRDVAFSRFLTTMGLLLKSGVPIIKALELASDVMQNVILQSSMAEFPERMRRGETLSAMLRADKRIPASLIQMVAIGEETGNLSGMLERAGVFYAKAVENTVKKITVMIEPFFLVVMGGAVAFVMASILTPLFRMINLAQM